MEDINFNIKLDEETEWSILKYFVHVKSCNLNILKDTTERYNTYINEITDWDNRDDIKEMILKFLHLNITKENFETKFKLMKKIDKEMYDYILQTEKEKEMN